METKTAVAQLAALAQENRLAIFRLLVQAGPEGLSAGRIAESLGLPNATLSFHLRTLSQADLLSATQAGRFIRYAANFPAMNALIGFLGENCCAGEACGLPALNCCTKEECS
ncbi:ArsR/SmtB family transcription factor [Uliginosibacterium paludis]|jgi:DNA-binding transcriptional ArsR family regulator|uniref:Metalloregulator ArsR/SmtB family transcription factor n=1 Tax=Uliginosibacterium paludis TaxID=1615952 RepID=A0ABV2CNE1_9RHOO